MSKPSIADRLNHILLSIKKIRALWAEKSYGDFLNDDIAAAATERFLEKVSEDSRHIPPELISQRPDIAWRDIADLGNFIRHTHHRVEATIIWDIVQNHLPVLDEAIRFLSQAPEFNDTRAFWDKRYSGEMMAFGVGPNEFLAIQRDRLQPGMRALVPGDGQGRNGVWLAEQGLIVDTVDISPIGIAKAQALAAERHVTINAIQADLLTWDWPRNAYDVIASIYLHFFDIDRPRIHHAMLAALKPGGLFILEAFNPGQLELQKTEHSGGPKTADMLFSVEKLRADFAGAEILLLEECVVDLDEGHRHKGKGAVTRLIARRPG